MRRKLSVLALAFVLLGVLAFFPTHVSAHTAITARPATTCHGLSCDGKDPNATGCYINATQEKEEALAHNAGVIFLYYSHPCDTWYGEVVSGIGATLIVTDIYLGNGARGHTKSTKNTETDVSYMIYDGDYRVTVYLFGYVNNSGDSGLLTS